MLRQTRGNCRSNLVQVLDAEEVLGHDWSRVREYFRVQVEGYHHLATRLLPGSQRGLEDPRHLAVIRSPVPFKDASSG
jgi:hypothetical protein